MQTFGEFKNQIISELTKNHDNEKTVYLAGPFNGDVAEHKRQARLAASDLRKRGFAVIVPHLESEGCSAILDGVGWMQHGFGLLRAARFIALFGDWQNSTGTLMELNNAAIWGKPLIAIYNKAGQALFCCTGGEMKASEYKKEKTEKLSDEELETLFGKKKLPNTNRGPVSSREIFEHQVPEHLRSEIVRTREVGILNSLLSLHGVSIEGGEMEKKDVCPPWPIENLPDLPESVNCRCDSEESFDHQLTGAFRARLEEGCRELEAKTFTKSTADADDEQRLIGNLPEIFAGVRGQVSEVKNRNQLVTESFDENPLAGTYDDSEVWGTDNEPNH